MNLPIPFANRLRLRFLQASPPTLPEGVRVYAVGDVHGRFDLLCDLLRRVETDFHSRDAAETHLIMLGDLIDRGPHSDKVCRLLHALSDAPRFHCLRGNHEQVLLDVLAGNLDALKFWLRFGGRETLRSWGVDEHLLARAWRDADDDSAAHLVTALRSAIPDDILAWLHDLPVSIQLGDYFFVHAGLRPKRALEDQTVEDMLWIREPFLKSRRRYPCMVVHGHSETDEPQLLHNRIGVDTGAYRTGILTAIGLEGTDRWLVQTGG